MRRIVVIAHNLRSTHNVGSLLRTAEGLGVEKVYLTGYTPYPKQSKDSRLPHLAEKMNAAIQKTALGAEKAVNWKHEEDIHKIIIQLKKDGFNILALEQTASARPLHDIHSNGPIALVIGNEVTGIEKDLLIVIPMHTQIPMLGSKESFNVVQAAAMALFHLRLH